MPPLPPTPAGKIILFHRSTGDRFERWAIDAREMIATGDYTLEPPDGHVEPAVAPLPSTIAAPGLPKEVAPGVPAVHTHARDAGPATPFQVPAGRTKKKEK